jgi:uncharacterized membrane protein YqaE (UPF0057 family)
VYRTVCWMFLCPIAFMMAMGSAPAILSLRIVLTILGPMR